jgi:hypothetical protein
MDFDDIPLDAYFVSPNHILGGVVYQKVNGDDGYMYWNKRNPQGMSDDTFPEFKNVRLITKEEALQLIAKLH